MNFENLAAVIKNNDIDQAIDIIEEIGTAKNEQAVPILIQYLQSTENHLLRNAIAIALSDIGKEEAVEPIIGMIRDSRTIGHRGTLLYALQPFDCSQYIELLVECVCKGNFEVRKNSFELLANSIKSDISIQTQLKLIQYVNNELDELKDKIELTYEVLELLINIDDK